MGKEAILQTKQVEHVRNERQLLGLLRHPFIVQFYASFQDTRNVYLGMYGIGAGRLLWGICSRMGEVRIRMAETLLQCWSTCAAVSSSACCTRRRG
jgi:serine/threonine protein kinase